MHKDSVVEMSESSYYDNSGLFSEETDEAKIQQEKAVLTERSAIPGMLKPSEIDSDF